MFSILYKITFGLIAGAKVAKKLQTAKFFGNFFATYLHF